MKLLVRAVEARGLPAGRPNGSNSIDSYVRLQLGKQRAKSKVVKKGSEPCWEEDFSFAVGDLREELAVSVFDRDDLVGRVKVPLSEVVYADGLSLGTQWYQLQPKDKKAKAKDCGQIRLGIFLSPKNTLGSGTSESHHSYSDEITSSSDKSTELTREPPLSSSNENMESSSFSAVEDAKPLEEGKLNAPSLVDRLFQFFTGRNAENTTTSPQEVDIMETVQDDEMDQDVSINRTSSALTDMAFDDLLKEMEAKDQGREMPANLPGGVVLDQSYAVSPSVLNSLIFSPTSSFMQSLADHQGVTGWQAEPWKLENDGGRLRRVLTYINPASKLVKAVKVTEDQVYLKADGNSFAVLLSVSVPDVPFGKCFKTEMLFCIFPGPEIPSGEPCSRLVISWRVNFVQSTMMKGMIENGARQGIKQNFALFAELLSQNVKPVDSKDVASSKEILDSPQPEEESERKFRFIGNFSVVFSLIVGSFVMLHMILVNLSKSQGLEFPGLDLPDSIGELVVCAVLVLQAERAFNMIRLYMHVRKQRGSDHGVRAHGDGWLLTVALIEGSNLAAGDSSGYSDPYVVFTLHGKTKRSSIKFQTQNPRWNELFEFDPMDDPPSMMNINVFDFKGPFDEAVSLGHAEVNFVKYNLSDLADIWITLQGKLAQACQSKLHLRILLNNTRGNEVVTKYLTKMEKEVGKKLNVRSPQANSAFQKIFGLPPEEFLINDFTCHLKRKMPLHGRLFLSPRIIGFYANIFGHKTKFFFLWEDIEDIQVIPPSISSMGSPSLIILLRPGRGQDASHGAKSVDKDGRLKFQFQTFVSFSAANRIIMALWKARSLTPEQKVQIVEVETEQRSPHTEGSESLVGIENDKMSERTLHAEESGSLLGIENDKMPERALHAEESGSFLGIETDRMVERTTLHTEESGSFLGVEDAKMSEVLSSVVPLPSNTVMKLFGGGSLERKIMEKVGCVDYFMSTWEEVRPDVFQRQVSYNFDKNITHYDGSVSTTQQKSRIPDNKGWVVEEVMTLQDIYLGDYFDLHIRYSVEDLPPKSFTCSFKVSVGISWFKSNKHAKRISKNVISSASHRVKAILRQIEKEFSLGK